MFTYPIHYGGIPASAFDAEIEALSPSVWYKFDDTSYATTLADSGTTGATLTSQNTTDASAATPMRSTRTKALGMPACTDTNWATEGAHYTDAAGAIAGVFSGLTAFTVVHSVRMTANSFNSDIYLFRLGTNNTTQTAGGFRAMFDNPSTTGTISLQETHTTGNIYQSSTSTQLDDGTPHLVIHRFGPSARKLELDGTEEVSTTWGATTQTTAAAFNVGGLASASGYHPAWETDCFALWDSYLTDGQIANLWTYYNAELAP